VQTNYKNSWIVLLLAMDVAGCAGNGVGIPSADGPVTADFQSIQDNVFTPICTKCHIGLSAPEGLQLDADHAYNMLVGVPSVEQSSLLRVDPGNPDASYLVHKIEGASGIDGGQMPLGETPLPQATIDAIRQWITHGAQKPAVAAQVFAVQGSAPMDRSVVSAAPAQILVTFTQDVDASVVNENTVLLERVGDPSEETAGRPATSILSSVNPAVLLITPRAKLTPGLYRVTLRGSGDGAVANLNATILGADAAFEFTVEPAQ
jgi:methionine-rich copper-binding protein CopC